MVLHYRDEEAIFVQAAKDRVTVIFSTVFREETDRIFGKVFLQVRPTCLLVGTLIFNILTIQEFVDARRLPTIQNAPQVLYSNRNPPLEIQHVPGLQSHEDIGYVTFVLFPRHFANPTVSAATISHIQLFRDYLHYHIKCSKAYMHSRMRHRVAEFQKVLNRAKTEVATERKTARCASSELVALDTLTYIGSGISAGGLYRRGELLYRIHGTGTFHFVFQTRCYFIFIFCRPIQPKLDPDRYITYPSHRIPSGSEAGSEANVRGCWPD